MLQILFAGRDISSLPVFIEAIEESGGQATCLDTGKGALFAVSEKAFDLLIAAEKLEDISGIGLIEAVIAIQPMLNCAVVSSLSPNDFHEASEGLGILMQLPEEPGREAADALMSHLKKIQSFKVGS